MFSIGWCKDQPVEVFYYSCWSKISLLLTIAELPGIYARTDTREVWSLDHIEARFDGSDLVLHNSTKWPAVVAVLVEDSAVACTTAPGDALLRKVVLAPAETICLPCP